MGADCGWPCGLGRIRFLLPFTTTPCIACARAGRLPFARIARVILSRVGVESWLDDPDTNRPRGTVVLPASMKGVQHSRQPFRRTPSEPLGRHLHGGVEALPNQPDGQPPEVDGALVGGRHVREGHRGRLVRHSVHAVISCRLSVVTQGSRRWLRSISGVLTPTFSTQPPPVLDPFVDDAGALLGYAGSGA